MHHAPVIGVCAMDYKARSKSMRNILSRLLQTSEFDVIIFGDHVILDEPIEQWPKCDILLAFFSTGFPLHKAIQYYKLYKPYCVNDLIMQELLLDRRTVLAVLDAIDVPTPPRLIRNADEPKLSQEVINLATRNFGIDLFHECIRKDAVVETEDALIIGNRMISKPFVEKPADAENHNINIYNPDGSGRHLFRKVENKSSEAVESLPIVRHDGKSYIYEKFLSMDNCEDVKVYTVGPYHAYAETRLSPSISGIVKRNSEGKEMRKVTQLTAEEQIIAGRICMAFGQSICGFDMLRVGGKSYVIDVNGWSFVKGSEVYDELCSRILRNIFLKIVPNSLSLSPLVANEEQGAWRLKTFIEVLRHGDRTPKLKYKLTTDPGMFQELEGVEDRYERLVITERLCKEYLEAETDEKTRECLNVILQVITPKKILQSTKVQRRPTRDGKYLLIIKWGGEFTHSGRHQAQELGENTRKDLSLLNKDILKNIKVKCSVERRVQATADVFTKGLLKMAEVPHGLIEERKDLLDHAPSAKPYLESVKEMLASKLNEKEEEPQIAEMLYEFRENLLEMRERLEVNVSQLSGEDLLKFQWCCSETPTLFRERWGKHFRDLLDCAKIEPARITDFYDSLKYDALHNREFLKLMMKPVGALDDGEELIRSLFEVTQKLFAYLTPKDHGITSAEKKEIGMAIVGPLLKDILSEIEAGKAAFAPSCRFYFTKESHMVALLNVLVNSGLELTRKRTTSTLFPEELTDDPSWFGELDYLSQICIELYEKKKGSPDRVDRNYSVRVGMSPGAHDPHILDLNLDRRHFLSVAPKRWLTPYIPLERFQKVFNGTK